MDTIKRRGHSPAKRRKWLYTMFLVAIVALVVACFVYSLRKDKTHLVEHSKLVVQKNDSIVALPMKGDASVQMVMRGIAPPHDDVVTKVANTSEVLVNTDVSLVHHAQKAVSQTVSKSAKKKTPKPKKPLVVLIAQTKKISVRKIIRRKPRVMHYHSGEAIGGPLMKNIGSPDKLAVLVESALKTDPTGNSHLNEEMCRKLGSCASAYSYFYGIRTTHPDTASRLKKVSDLPKYLRSLRRNPAPSGDWLMSRILISHNNKRSYDYGTWHRTFHLGEAVWDDPISGDHILAGDCGNVVGSRFDLSIPVPRKPSTGCVEINFTTKPGDTAVKIAIMGPSGNNITDDVCTGIDGHGWVNNVCPQYPHAICDFSEHERVTGKKVRLVGSFRPVPGKHVLSLPGNFTDKNLGYITALILVRGNIGYPKYPDKPLVGNKVAFSSAYKYGEERVDWINRNSDAIGVRWFDYNHRSAKIWYLKSQLPKNAPQLYWPWGEWTGTESQ